MAMAFFLSSSKFDGLTSIWQVADMATDFAMMSLYASDRWSGELFWASLLTLLVVNLIPAWYLYKKLFRNPILEDDEDGSSWVLFCLCGRGMLIMSYAMSALANLVTPFVTFGYVVNEDGCKHSPRLKKFFKDLKTYKQFFESFPQLVINAFYIARLSPRLVSSRPYYDRYYQLTKGVDTALVLPCFSLALSAISLVFFVINVVKLSKSKDEQSNQEQNDAAMVEGEPRTNAAYIPNERQNHI